MITTAEGGLIAILDADATVSGIVGGRIHPMTDPRNTPFPKITYQRIDTVRGLSNDGPTNCPTARVQIDCWAADLLAARTLANAVRRALNGFSGTADGYQFDLIHLTDERDREAAPLPGHSARFSG